MLAIKSKFIESFMKMNLFHYYFCLLITPKVSEPLRGELVVEDGVVDAGVAEVGLDSAGVVLVV